MIFIAAGSSLPFCGLDSQQIVAAAFAALSRIAEVRGRSPFYESPAWPDAADPAFINAAAQIETDLSPASLLAALHAIEAGFGRRRTVPNAPRTLDLDLLAYRDVRADGKGGGPILPHPGLSIRDFALAPLCDLAPDWRHPGTGETAAAMLAALPSRSARRIS